MLCTGGVQRTRRPATPINSLHGISVWWNRKFHGNAVKQFQKMQPPQVGFLSQKWSRFPFGRCRPYTKVKPFKTYKTLGISDISYLPSDFCQSFLYKILETKKTEMCGESPLVVPREGSLLFGHPTMYLQLGRLRPGGQATATW